MISGREKFKNLHRWSVYVEIFSIIYYIIYRSGIIPNNNLAWKIEITLVLDLFGFKCRCSIHMDMYNAS